MGFRLGGWQRYLDDHGCPASECVAMQLSPNPCKLVFMVSVACAVSPHAHVRALAKCSVKVLLTSCQLLRPRANSFKLDVI